MLGSICSVFDARYFLSESLSILHSRLEPFPDPQLLNSTTVVESLSEDASEESILSSFFHRIAAVLYDSSFPLIHDFESVSNSIRQQDFCLIGRHIRSLMTSIKKIPFSFVPTPKDEL